MYTVLESVGENEISVKQLPILIFNYYNYWKRKQILNNDKVKI